METVTGWEYRRRVATVWNEMGEEGWELCGVWAFLLYFKRPLSRSQHV